MELIIVVALVCLGIAAQPFAARRLSPVVQSTLGSLCVGISLVLTALVGSGLVQLPQPMMAGGQAQAALPDVNKPAVPEDASPSAEGSPASPAEKPSVVPNDESRFFVPPEQTPDGIKLYTDDDETVIIPPGRPNWVGQAPQLEGAIHSTAVCSDPYATHQQAIQALDKKLEVATADYIRQHLQSDLAPQLISYDARQIHKRLLPPQNVYHEKIKVSIGPMHQVHALVEFSPEFREELDRRWSELRATYRLAETGIVGGGVLLVLATIFGYFRLDNATRGYYTSRLQFMAAAAILAIVGTSALVSKWWIYWL
ncbi:hypothetical protein ETAA8_06120 [Anatilimnocola aggregata]|uniref:Uncharacterized protein n=1 Tax=Anatilimnocola aggregata TaxID=2528021 RepID=A0A517Y5M3_9BACT|nr:hypothetical protein [Anatilimnocola aggregata]QDU25543.1 hypothetical protein ETAA8_06120 [Anatilimnocola aggregata]